MIRRCAPVLLIGTLALSTGCQSSRNQINPYMGYGSPRIPAPGTGSYQIREPYVQQQSNSELQQQNQVSGADASSDSQQGADFAASGGWRAPRGTTSTAAEVQPAGATSKSSVIPAKFQNTEAPKTPPASTDSSLIKRIEEGRLHVNEPNSSPGSFVPPKSARKISETSTRSTSQPVPSSDSKSSAAAGWRAKYTPTGNDEVVAR